MLIRCKLIAVKIGKNYNVVHRPFGRNKLLEVVTKKFTKHEIIYFAKMLHHTLSRTALPLLFHKLNYDFLQSLIHIRLMECDGFHRYYFLALTRLKSSFEKSRNDVVYRTKIIVTHPTC